MNLAQLESRLTPIVSTYGGLLNFGNGTGASAPWPGYAGGLNVTQVGDVNADGVGDVVVGAAAGGGPRISIIDGSSRAVLDNRFAFESEFRGGVYVGHDGDDPAGGDGGTLYVGAGEGGGPAGVRYGVAGGRFVERDRAFYGDPSARAGLRFDGNSDSGKPLDYTVGTGAYAVYLQLDHLRGFQARAVADRVFQLFAGIAGSIRVTTVKPNDFPGTYITAWTREDLRYTGFGNAEGFASRTIRNQPASGYDPAVVHVSKNVTLLRMPTVIAHELGHWFGLAHSDRAGNLMLPNPQTGNTLNDPAQAVAMAGAVAEFQARRTG